MTKEMFDELWTSVVCGEAHKIQKRFPDIYFDENCKDEVFNFYNELITHCKNKYMKDIGMIVDRHKVASCIMIAILEFEPINYTNAKYYKVSPKSWLFNEKIALTAALSALRCFIIERLETGKYKSLNDADVEKIHSALSDNKGGIVFPETYHGEYSDNYLFEIYCAKKENSFNILSFSNELFLLEQFTIDYYKKL